MKYLGFIVITILFISGFIYFNTIKTNGSVLNTIVDHVNEQEREYTQPEVKSERLKNLFNLDYVDNID